MVQLSCYWGEGWTWLAGLDMTYVVPLGGACVKWAWLGLALPFLAPSFPPLRVSSVLALWF